MSVSKDDPIIQQEWATAEAILQEMKAKYEEYGDQLYSGYKIRKRDRFPGHPALPASFIYINQKLYRISVTLGSGRSGTVKLLFDKNANIFTIKRITFNPYKGCPTEESTILHMLNKFYGDGMRATISIKDDVPDGDYKYYMVMQYEKGTTLNKFLKTAQQLNDTKKCQIALNFINALNELHQHGIIHSDLHEENIIVNPRTLEIAIVDFGLCIKVDDPQLSVVHPKFKGLPAERFSFHFHPETRQHGTVSGATDIWLISYTLDKLNIKNYWGISGAELRANIPPTVPLLIKLIQETIANGYSLQLLNLIRDESNLRYQNTCEEQKKLQDMLNSHNINTIGSALQPQVPAHSPQLMPDPVAKRVSLHF